MGDSVESSQAMGLMWKVLYYVLVVAVGQLLRLVQAKVDNFINREKV